LITHIPPPPHPFPTPCLFSSSVHVGVGGGGGGLDVVELLRVKNFSSICLYCIISSKPWGGEGVGGGRSVYSRHLYILGCAGGGWDASEQNNVRTLCFKKS
jgi:hypothetical protein